jgi:hypothetical protein
VEKKFTGLRKLFADAGASAGELADLEQLHGIERTKAIEDASKAMTSTLKGLIDDLTQNNDAFSLRDRLQLAKAKYDPLAADVAAGKKVDYDAFSEATRAVETIMRALEGSQTGYFDFVDQAKGLALKALAEQQGLISAATGSALGSAPAGMAPGTDSTPVVSAVDRLGGFLGRILIDEVGGRLDAMNTNVGRLLTATLSSGGGGGDDYIYADRKYF